MAPDQSNAPCCPQAAAQLRAKGKLPDSGKKQWWEEDLDKAAGDGEGSDDDEEGEGEEGGEGARKRKRVTHDEDEEDDDVQYFK